MKFNTVEGLKNSGFIGFKTVQSLFDDASQLPTEKGVYIVLYLEDRTPVFLQEGTGGHFKGRNPNTSLENLTSNWVDKTPVVYIGKAGGDGRAATLRSRLKQYLAFGQCRNVGHWGGRLIWQITFSEKLVICWKPLPNDHPREVESQLITEFVAQFGRRPFANLIN